MFFEYKYDIDGPSVAAIGVVMAALAWSLTKGEDRSKLKMRWKGARKEWANRRKNVWRTDPSGSFATKHVGPS